MIETESRPEVASFYDSLSDDYDLMTDFSARFSSEEPAFRNLIAKYNIRTVLDAGAGTGLHSLILARLGVHVTAVDISGAMLRRLALKAEVLGVHVDTIESSLEDLPIARPGSADAVFCLGNTISHVQGDDDLRRVLANFSAALRPDGVLMIQMPNYEKILRDAVRLQDVRERNGTIFIRYYDVEPGFIRFNILTLKPSQGYSLQSVNHHPLVRVDLFRLLPQAGFSQPEFFADLSMQAFNPLESKSLVALTKKTGDGQP
jgi:SAM-dependent methyltransferase